MKSSIVPFVLDLVRAPALAHPHLLPARPEFHGDSLRMREAYDVANAIHASMPFLASMEKVLWKNDVAPAVRLLFEERLSRERMLLALLDRELDDALEALVEAGIPVILLKGMDLGRRYYPERAHRPMTDADLLVPKESFVSAVRALGSRGFRIAGPFPEGRFRVELSRYENGPVIELHTKLLAADRWVDTVAQWDRSVSSVFSDRPERVWALVRALGPEDQVLYLLRHASIQHVVESPIWLNDLHFVIEAERGLDWNSLVEAFEHKRAASAAYFVLSFLQEEWGTRIPDEAIARLGRKIGRVRRTLLSRMIDSGTWFDPTQRNLAWLVRARFLLRDSAGDAIRYGIDRRRKARQGVVPDLDEA